jgi:hypothetical protein
MLVLKPFLATGSKPTRSVGAPSRSRENSNTDCAGKLAALLVWAPGKVIPGTEPFCDCADASADIADASTNAFDESAGTCNNGAQAKHFCDALSRLVGWVSGVLQCSASALSSFASAAACEVFVGDGFDWGFSVERAAASLECLSFEAATQGNRGWH